MPNNAELTKFQEEVWQYYDRHGRHDLPWRLPDDSGRFDPYRVLVSEVMLQQTQVRRVTSKYQQFLELFPTVADLSKASLSEVLIAWQGLGYNRRAKFLWQAARMVVNDYGGVFPAEQRELTKLPGVGLNTAGAVMAYAYNQPAVFVETNIRTVFIHHFFGDAQAVNDKEITELVAKTSPTKGQGSARLWYWALMDYGSHLKQAVGNKSRASKTYVKQSPFAGSRRAVRGAVIRHLSQQPAATSNELAEVIGDPRLVGVLEDLYAEGMVREQGGSYRLA